MNFLWAVSGAKFGFGSRVENQPQGRKVLPRPMMVEIFLTSRESLFFFKVTKRETRSPHLVRCEEAVEVPAEPALPLEEPHKQVSGKDRLLKE